eukprot:3257730-Lingulodinium_polyedra.AAC.1
MEQREFLAKATAEMVKAMVCPVATRFYDCTPVRMAFGKMQPQLFPVARYPLRVNDVLKILPLA